MAQKVEVTKVSDLSGEPADETVAFSLDGKDYEIDLSADEARGMRSGVAAFTEHARKVTARATGKRARKRSRDDLPDIREYMRQRGHKVNDRGRVPAQLIAEYDLLTSYGKNR